MTDLKVKEYFNKAENTYDYNCALQIRVGLKLIDTLQKYNLKPKSIIDLGCGTGIVTGYLFDRYNANENFALDIADRLLAKARARLINTNFIQGDFDSDLENDELDLIFSNMALQWSSNLYSTLSNIFHHMNACSILAFSIPVDGTFDELPENSKISFRDFEEIKSLLIINGFNILEASSERITQTYASLIQALKSIKGLGANYCNANNNFSSLYKIHKANLGIFNLTYNMGYFLAKKAA